MNGKKTRLLKKQAVQMALQDGRSVKDVYKGLKTMLKAGIIKFDK